MTKYIFVTGGVLSGLGKGVTAASVGNILKARGYRVFMQKFDQYINVDAGTLNPGEHGEVFVTDDGAETDLDLGHYERFIDINLDKTSSIMTGEIYRVILEKERRGDFLGKTVQMIPHVTNEVKARIEQAAKKSKAQILIVEVGGTVGDYEGAHFLEAIRQMKSDEGEENVCYIHVGFLPYLKTSEEIKTKPIQNSVHDLQAMGIQPDILICRSDHQVSKTALEKTALFTGIDPKAVIPLETVKNIYQVPLILEQFGLAKLLEEKLSLSPRKDNNHQWKKMVKKILAPKKRKVRVGLVGKYMAMKDTYLSVTEAVKAAAWANRADLEIVWIDSERLEKKDVKEQLKNVDAITVPGGFGTRGIEGKIKAIQYVRENGLPFLGLCLGLQCAVIEFARNVCGLENANSTEFSPRTKYPVIDILPTQKGVKEKGGTMRLGSYPAKLLKGSVVEKLYSASRITRYGLPIYERHRHRFEVNPKFHNVLKSNGLVFSGTSPDGKLVEFIEIPNHPYFVATQAHPEFKSRPHRPHPLFDGLIKAALKSKI